MSSFTLDAPAKINLHLRILGKRGDGFHALETRLAPLELADRVTLTPDPSLPAGAVALTCDDASLPCDESNLAVRAARALEAETGPLPGMRLRVEKRVPHGAGLGGGSSDAAAVLRLIQRAFRPDLPDAALHKAAAAVGSDVPFFLDGGVCDATGRGEILTPVPEFTATPRVLLVKLPFGIPTPWAYKNWLTSAESPGLPYAPQQTPWGALVNDLERPVFEKYPVLGLLKARLLRAPGVAGALMSGSGSTVFALLEENADSRAALDAVLDEAGDELWIHETRVRARRL